MSYTSITTTRPGPRMQAAETSEEGDALLAEVFGVLAANGGEMGNYGRKIVEFVPRANSAVFSRRA